MSDQNWTIMLYLAGDNNLSEHLLTALDSVKEIADNDRITVLAQFDPFSSIQEARRFKFDGATAASEQPLVAFQVADSGKPKKPRRASRARANSEETHPLQSLSEFLEWAI